MSLGGFCKRNEGILQKKRGREKASYKNLHYLPDKNLQIRSQHAKTHQKNIIRPRPTLYPRVSGVHSLPKMTAEKIAFLIQPSTDLGIIVDLF